MNYSKEYQLRHHQKEKEKPKYKEIRYKKKKKRTKNPLKKEVYKGRTIPTPQQRGKISKKEYNEALRRQGEYCFVCHTNQSLEAHHVKFRSDGGRGTFRNIVFLCSEHHRGKGGPHHNESARRELEVLQESKYGPYYHCDVYDLFKLGLIDNTSELAYENFMQMEEERCKSGVGSNGINGNEK